MIHGALIRSSLGPTGAPYGPNDCEHERGMDGEWTKNGRKSKDELMGAVGNRDRKKEGHGISRTSKGLGGWEVDSR